MKLTDVIKFMEAHFTNLKNKYELQYAQECQMWEEKSAMERDERGKRRRKYMY